jgi:hypothetical protein
MNPENGISIMEAQQNLEIAAQLKILAIPGNVVIYEG